MTICPVDAVLHRVVFTNFFGINCREKYVDARYSLGARNIYNGILNVILIPQILLVLAKEIYEWCLVAEDIILLARKIIYT